jgi:hypothetical protein
MRHLALVALVLSACGTSPARAPEPVRRASPPGGETRFVEAHPSVACVGETRSPELGSSDPRRIDAAARRASDEGRHREAAVLYYDLATRFAAIPEGLSAAMAYLEALNAVGSKDGRYACYEDMDRDVPTLLATHCTAPRRAAIETCTNLVKIELDMMRLRIGREVAWGEEFPERHERVAETALGLFDAYCAPMLRSLGRDEMRCDELAFDAAMAFLATHHIGRAREVMARMLDPRLHLEQSPLTHLLVCKLHDGGRGRCP